MKPLGLSNLQAVVTKDQLGQDCITVLALDHRGHLWQRTFVGGTWSKWGQISDR